MFLRLLYQSFLRQRRRKLLAGIAIFLGITVITAVLEVSLDVGDKMALELRTYGANILITPAENSVPVEIGGIDLRSPASIPYLDEADLPKLKQIFWAHNILAFAPVLKTHATVAGSEVPLIGTYFNRDVHTESGPFTTGATKAYPWWRVDGRWPLDSSKDEALVGAALARKAHIQVNDHLALADGSSLTVTGILSAGSEEDGALVVPLSIAQRLIGRPYAVGSIYVSALTKPEDDFARRDPRSMSGNTLERWTCSPYANSIAYQIQQAIPGSHAEQIRRIAQTEGVVLSRISGLMWLIAVAALIAAALSVGAAMSTAILERRNEVGVMKSLGAGNAGIAALFCAEAAILSIVGGTLGWLAGDLIADRIGLSVFHSGIRPQPALIPVVLLLALAVTMIGSAVSIRRAVRFDPAAVLRGSA